MFEQHGLAPARGPDDRRDKSRRHVEVDSVEHQLSPEALAHLANPDRVCPRGGLLIRLSHLHRRGQSNTDPIK